MGEFSKEFVVSTANVAFEYNGALAFTGTSSTNASISVTTEDLEITGGKYDKLMYKLKYGKKLAAEIEVTEWNLAFIAAMSGTSVVAGLHDVYAIAECVQLTAGVGTLPKVPVPGTKVSVEKSDRTTIEVVPSGSTITVGSETEMVKVTYRFSKMSKRVTIDADSTPLVGKLIMTADKHDNKRGKIGAVQIVIPSFQLSGNFDISLEASGSATTSLSGDALAVEGDSCASGSVYAYVTDVNDDESSVVAVTDIAITPSYISITGASTRQLSVVGLMGGLYSPIEINPSDCTFTSSDEAVAIVGSDGVVTGVAVGACYVDVSYGSAQDTIEVTVTTTP